MTFLNKMLFLSYVTAITSYIMGDIRDIEGTCASPVP